MNRPKYQVWDGEQMRTVTLGPNDAGYTYGLCVDFSPGDEHPEEWVWREFTGLLDADGQEVYEGDVLAFATSGPEQFRAPVEHRASAFGFSDPREGTRPFSPFCTLAPRWSYRVVGHVFQPEYAHLRPAHEAP